MDRDAEGSRKPRSRVLVMLAVGLGVFAGLGSFTFGYGEGAAYLSDDPVACTNCHVMQEPYDSYVKSSHRNVATCNDCHLSPHPLGKWITKADNGFFHSLAFTTNKFRDPIRIKPRNARVTQKACLSCHSDFVESSMLAPAGSASTAHNETASCVSCHSRVGHAGR